VTAAAHTGGAAGNALIALVESHWGGGYRIVVVGLAVAVTDTAVASAAGQLAAVTVAHRGPDVVPVSIVEAVVRVVMVVVVADGFVAGMIMRMPGTVVTMVGVRSVPAPTVAETAVIPVGSIVVGTVVIVRPPPVVTQVNAYAPAGWTIVIPVHVREEGVIVTKTQRDTGVKSAEPGAVTIIIVVIGVVAGTAGGRSGCRIGDRCIVRDDRFRTARIIGQCAQQVAVLVGLIDDGIGLQGSAVGCDRVGWLRGARGHLLHGFFVRGRVDVIVIGEIRSRTGC